MAGYAVNEHRRVGEYSSPALLQWWDIHKLVVALVCLSSILPKHCRFNGQIKKNVFFYFWNENFWKLPTCPLVLWDHNQRASKYSRKSPSSPSKDLPQPPELKKCSKNPGTVVSPPRPQLNSLNCRAMPQHTSTRQDEIVFCVRSMRDEIANKCHSGPKEKGGGGNSSCLSSIILHKLDICPFCSELKF